MDRRCTYSGLEGSDLLVREGVRLGNDGDQVDLGVEALHDLDVQRLQRVASGLDEEDTSMNAVVNNVHPVDLVLSIQVSVEALLDVVGNWTPRLIVVDKVTETGRVDDGQSETDTGLLDICADGLNGDSLGEDVEARPLTLLGRVQRGVEQCVDQGRLSEPRLAWCEECCQNWKSRGRRRIQQYVPTTITLKLKPLRTLLRCHWFGRLAKPTYPVSFLRTMFLFSMTPP